MSDVTPIEQKTFAEAGSSQEAKRWADSTYWVRDYRQRKRLGLQLRRVGDAQAEGVAVEAYLDDSL
jgi:hypothetical protein